MPLLGNPIPLILDPKIWDQRLKREPEAVAALMKPANDDAPVSRPASKAVGNARNSVLELLAWNMATRTGASYVPDRNVITVSIAVERSRTWNRSIFSPLRRLSTVGNVRPISADTT